MLTTKVEQELRFTIKLEHLDNISGLIRIGITDTISEITREGESGLL